MFAVLCFLAGIGIGVLIMALVQLERMPTLTEEDEK